MRYNNRVSPDDIADAATAIETLLAERDAALEDLRIFVPCLSCLHREKRGIAMPCLNCNNRNWQWRGVQKGGITLNSTEICSAALEKWGPQAQTIMVFEEMSELQKELCKNQRGEENKDAIAEEIADVLITLEQMVVLHECETAVVRFREDKLKRLKERIEWTNR